MGWEVMSELDDLLNSISETIKTYRQGELPESTPQHVQRWANQFTIANQTPFLREINHVLKKTFITKKTIQNFIETLITNEELAGKDPKAYWSKANILNIQKHGHSQSEMVKVFKEALQNKIGLTIDDNVHIDGEFIYLDDVLFTGGRVIEDIESWILNDAPEITKLHIIVMARHVGGVFWVKRRLNELIISSGKSIKLKYWRIVDFENRKTYRNTSEVLWPTAISNDPEVQTYIGTLGKFPHIDRTPGHVSRFFSSEQGRQLLEQEFLTAGVRIRSMSNNPKPSIRPLGFSGFGVGFGSMLVTYRNCPNNCPLALWWGSSTPQPGALNWYPLLERKTYSSPTNIFHAFEDLTI